LRFAVLFGASLCLLALRCTRQTLGGAAGRGDLPCVEVTQFAAIGEQHAVTLPIETVGENHFAGRARGHPVKVDCGDHAVTDAQIDLVWVRCGKGVWLPERHVSIFADRQRQSPLSMHLGTLGVL
jgi:hypothetical protein